MVDAVDCGMMSYSKSNPARDPTLRERNERRATFLEAHRVE
jgi:hypothetical protein